MSSIRSRTAALVAGSTLVLLAMGGGVLLVVIRAALTAQFDDALAARAEALRSLTRSDGTEVEMDFAGESMPRFARNARTGSREAVEYFVAWVQEADAWRVLERSDSLRGQDWPGEPAAGPAVGTRDAALPDGVAGRVVVVEFAPTAEQDDEPERSEKSNHEKARDDRGGDSIPIPRARVLVAMARAPLDRTLVAVGWSVAGVGGALAMSSLLVVRWAVGRGLRPLSEMSRKVRALGPDSLTERFDAGPLPAELRPIAEQLSALLTRLDEAFQRERRFSAAASHELRTPIAELRMLLEVARSRPRTGEEWHDTGGRALGVLDRAQTLCETLLRLSRAERAAGGPPADARAEVEGVLADAVTRVVNLHGGDARRVQTRCEAGLRAWVDPSALDAVLTGLLDNALTHGAATPDDPVRVLARADGGRVRIDITNAAPGISKDDLDRFFEPFWRKEASRHDQRRFGLGLAVARAIARAQGGEVRAGMAGSGRVSLVVEVCAEGSPIGADRAA